MHYQLEFSFAADTPLRSKASTILTADAFLKDYLGEKYYAELKQSPKYDFEKRRIEQMINYVPGGDVVLFENVSKPYFVENFQPVFWSKHAGQIKEKRPIYKLDALKKDFSSTPIMIKGVKISMSCLYQPPKSWGTSIENIFAYKNSRDEAEMLKKLAESGVNVEKVLGYFEQSPVVDEEDENFKFIMDKVRTHKVYEQWLYTEFVDGQKPLELLANESDREQVWKADAQLLASLCKAKVKHQGFYSREFDDKVWKDGKMVLIDVDESFYIEDSRMYGEYFKANPGKLPDYFTSWVTDCVAGYLFGKVMRENEVQLYADEFCNSLGFDESIREKICKDADPQRQTEESYNAVMMDCD